MSWFVWSTIAKASYIFKPKHYDFVTFISNRFPIALWLFLLLLVCVPSLLEFSYKLISQKLLCQLDFCLIGLSLRAITSLFST